MQTVTCRDSCDRTKKVRQRTKMDQEASHKEHSMEYRAREWRQLVLYRAYVALDTITVKEVCAVVGEVLPGFRVSDAVDSTGRKITVLEWETTDLESDQCFLTALEHIQAVSGQGCFPQKFYGQWGV